MSKAGKKHIKAREALEAAHPSTWKDAFEFVVKNAHAKFNESVDADLGLGIDPTKGEQVVRGSVLLPNGTGKQVRILVFATGEHAAAAQAAGADLVGLDDLIEKIAGGWVDFDATVATPDVMGKVGRVAKILGPRGLLPNKKLGMVTFDVASVVSDLRQGRVTFRNDKSGVLHVSFGKISQGTDKLLENFASLMKSVAASKPPTSKGKFIRKVTISSTMGVGVSLNPDTGV